MNYYVTTAVDGRVITNREPVADPFIRHRICIGRRDLWRGLLTGYLNVTVGIDGDNETVFRTMNAHRMIFPLMKHRVAEPMVDYP